MTFAITPETDQAAIERYLRAVEGKAAEAGKRAGESLSKGLQQVPAAVDNSDLIRRAELLRQVADQLSRQHATTVQQIGRRQEALGPQGGLSEAGRADVTEQLVKLEQQRLAVERQIAEAVEHQRRLQHQMTEAGVSPELVHRKQLLEQITAELAKQHQQAVEVEQSHQFPKKGQQPAAPEVAEAATKQRLELEQRIADAQREQADVEQRMQALLDNSPLEVRRRAMEAVNAQLDTERQKLAQINALSDPKHVQERLAVEKQIAEVRRQQAEATPKEPPAAALDARAETLKQITEQIKQQTQQLEQQKLLLDPAVVVERKKLEAIREQVAAAKQRAEEAVKGKDETVKPKFDLKGVLEAFKEGGIGAGLKAAMSSALSGVDVPQLIAGALGAIAGGGGAKGAAGAVVGGVVGAKAEAAAAPPTTGTSIREQREPARQPTAQVPRLPEGLVPQRQGLQVPRTAEPTTPRTQVPAGGPSQQGAPPTRPPASPTAAAEAPASGAGLSGQAVGEVAGAAAGGGAEAGAGAAAGMGAEALAGPIGLAVVAVQAAVKVSGQLASLPYAAINAGLSLVKDGLQDMEGPLGPLGAGINVVSKGMRAFADGVASIPVVGDALGPALKQLAAVPDTFKAITESLVRMSRLASPAQALRLRMATEDAQAVVGRSFLPVLAMITDGVRLAGDALASFLPNDREVNAALRETREALAPLGQMIRQALSTLGPTVRQQLTDAIGFVGKIVSAIATGLQELPVGQTIELFAEIGAALKQVGSAVGGVGLDLLKLELRGIAIAVRFVVEALDAMLEPLREIGVLSRQITGGQGEGARSSQNAAARPAQFQSIESYQQQLQQGAYGQAQGPQEQMVTQQQAANVLLTNILDRLSYPIGVRILENLVPDTVRNAMPTLSIGEGVNPRSFGDVSSGIGAALLRGAGW